MTGTSNTPKMDFKFALVTTGGTIAGLKTDEKHYQSAELKGQTFAAQFGLNHNKASDPTATLAGQVEWVVFSPYSIGSQNLSWKEMFTLREQLIELNFDASVDGVLVTHGTDTMEDMLFFLHLTMPALNKPILFTGSMLTSDSPDSDAPKNISDALAFLKGLASCSLPLLGLVMNGKYTPARHVQKRSVTGVDTFDAQESISILKLRDERGALLSDSERLDGVPSGSLEVDSVSSDFLKKIRFEHQQSLNPFKIDLSGLTAEQLYQKFERIEVELIYCTPNLKTGAIQSRFDQLQSVRSVAALNDLSAEKSNTSCRCAFVIAAPGNGNVPSRFIPELQSLISQGVRVVRASRITQSALVEGGELTGLESAGQLGASPLPESQLSTPQLLSPPSFTGESKQSFQIKLDSFGHQYSRGDGLYHESHGLSLNQIMVAETCRLLAI